MESSKTVCRTVRGDVDPGTGVLGRVLAHEHLLGLLVGPGTLGGGRRGAAEFDDAQVASAVQALSGLRELGFGTVVDLSPYGDVGRDAHGANTVLLRRIAEASGMHIVAGTATYREEFSPEWVRRASVDDLVRRFVADATTGIGSGWGDARTGGSSSGEIGTSSGNAGGDGARTRRSSGGGIGSADGARTSGSSSGDIGTSSGSAGTAVRAGILGEQPTSEGRITEHEERGLRAVARAHHLTGLSISTHTTHGTMALEQIDLLLQEQVPLDRVIIGHMDNHPELDYVRRVLDRGVTIGFDSIGKQHWDVRRPPLPDDHPDGRYAKPAITQSDRTRARHLAALVAEGYADQIVLSQDLTGGQMWLNPATHGRHGYRYLGEVFLPHLEEHGVGADAIDRMLIANPTRLLSRAAG